MARCKPGTIKHGIFEGVSFAHFNFIVEYTKDFNPQRASIACGWQPEHGYVVRKKPEVMAAIEYIAARRIEESDVDAAWVLDELIDNHYIARSNNQISASNQALNMIAKHCNVDAYAAEKVKIDTADDVVQRLKRARNRVETDDKEISFF